MILTTGLGVLMVKDFLKNLKNKGLIFVFALSVSEVAIADSGLDLLNLINSVRNIYEKTPLVRDPKLMHLAKKEISDKNFCVSNTSLRLVQEQAAKEVAWACGIKSYREVFQFWVDRTEFVLATSRRDISLVGIAHSEDNWIMISK